MNIMLTLTLWISAVILIVLPFWAARHYRRKHALPKKLFWIGIFAFVVIQLIEVALLKMFGIFDVVSGVVAGSSTVETGLAITKTIFYVALFSAFFIEIAKYVAFKKIIRSVDSYRNTVQFGIGFAGIKMLSVGFATFIIALSVVLLPYVQGNEEVLQSMTADDLARLEIAQEELKAVKSMPAYMPLITIVEEVARALFTIALTVLVFAAVVFAKPIFLIGSILLHAAAELMIVYLASVNLFVQTIFLVAIGIFATYVLLEFKRVFKVK